MYTIIDLIGKNTYFNFSDETGASLKIVLQVFNDPLITHNSTFGVRVDFYCQDFCR